MINEVKVDDLTFIGTDPGAVKFGNFINYYSFHNINERTSKLHPNMFPESASNSILCLDVGCNTGDLTKELYNYLKTIYLNKDIYILGIDIDPKLIIRAQESNNYPNIQYIAGNILEETTAIQGYLASHEKDMFDITFCFSVTMWIHINNGDEGLLDFLKYIQSVTRTAIVEPQPWNCYRTAQRRLKKSGSSFQHYEQLKIRSNVESVIENVFLENNYLKIYESTESSWNRKVHSYHKR